LTEDDKRSKIINKHAQTIIQLYDQLRDFGYSSSDLLIAKKAYSLAQRLYAFRFQGDGKPFISHGIGTASVLCNQKAPIELIAAGLIHNVYVNGDFGFLNKSGVTKAKRRVVKNAVGAEIEQYVHGLRAVRSKFRPLRLVCDESVELTKLEKNVILMQLADQMDLYVNRASSYYHDPEPIRTRIQKGGKTLIKIAETCGYPELALEFTQLFEVLLSVRSVPKVFQSLEKRNASSELIPKSCQKKFSLRFYESINNSVLTVRGKLKIRTRFQKLLRPAPQSAS